MGVYITNATSEQVMKVLMNSTEWLPDDAVVYGVQTPHGRLIDYSEVCEQVELMRKTNGVDRGFMDVALAVTVAPTVIEAEE